jgi:hypothetical protein
MRRHVSEDPPWRVPVLIVSLKYFIFRFLNWPTPNMAGPKNQVKVAKFLSKWLDMSIERHRVSRWLKPDPDDLAKVVLALSVSQFLLHQ